jgi:hypothetical protein
VSLAACAGGTAAPQSPSSGAKLEATPSPRTALCASTAALFSTPLRAPIRITAYVTRGTPTLDAFASKLQAILTEYATVGRDKFEFAIVEAKDEETRAKAKAAGLQEQKFGEGSRGAVTVTQGFLGLALQYGEEKDTIGYLPPDRPGDLEYQVSRAVRQVRARGDGARYKIGLLTGHDELQPAENDLLPPAMGRVSMQGIITQNFPFYTFQPVDLRGGESEIPEDLAGLLVTQPGKDLSERELRRIDQFVMKGKTLVVFASAVNVRPSDPTMRATLNAHGLEKLALGYGIGMNEDVVLDRAGCARVGGAASADFPPILDVHEADSPDPARLIDGSFPGLFEMVEVSVPLASSLTLAPEKQPKASVRAVLRSSPSAVHLTGESADLSPFQAWAPKLAGQGQQQFVVAATAMGTLRTAFPAGANMGVVAPAESTGLARVFVLSSSQPLSNPLARAGSPSATNPAGDETLLRYAAPYAQQYVTSAVLVFKNTLDWLALDRPSWSCFQ